MTDFTTLANAKQYLRINGNNDDALITRLINSATKLIQTYLNRDILAKEYTEFFNGTNNSFHMVGNYPINSVSFVMVNDTSIMPSTSVFTSGYRFDTTSIVLNGAVFSKGNINCKVVYNAGFSEVPAEIEQACLEIVSFKYKQIEHIDQQSKVVAGETVSFIVTDIPKMVKVVLNNYKKVISF